MTAVLGAAAVPAATLPAHAAPPRGRVHGAGAPGSVTGGHLVTPAEGTSARSAAGREFVEGYGVRISHTYGTAPNGYAVRAGAGQAGRPAAGPRVAAGNGGKPAAPHSPAGVRQATTVGATDRQDKKPAFSHHGSALDPFVPGVSVAPASAASDSGRATRSGTSAASPHAAGAAALRLAEHPRAAPAQVEKALVAGAVSGKVAGRGLGSPNRLLQVPRP